MAVLGVRCSNTDCTLCVVSGSSDAPRVDSAATTALPAGFTKAEALKWLLQEIDDFLKGKKIKSVVLKAAEPNVRRNKALDDRLQNEAIVCVSSASAGIKTVLTKVKATIAKDLGLKGKAKYLVTKLDTSIIDGFEEYSAKEQEAILAAWSEL